MVLTWVLSSFVPVDEAGDEHDQCEESDGAHQADEPALRRDSAVHSALTWLGGVGGVGWGRRRGWIQKKKKRNSERKAVDFDTPWPFHRDAWWNVYNRRSRSVWRSGGQWKGSNINIKQLIRLV